MGCLKLSSICISGVNLFEYPMVCQFGNVLAVIKDGKIPFVAIGFVYSTDVVQYTDYFPFGVELDMRHGTENTERYKFGYQGQLLDDDIKGDGNSNNYKYRMNDPRIGRFFALDPLAYKYSYNSPYAFSENRVLDGVELEGLEFFFTANGVYMGQIGNDPTIRVVKAKNIALVTKHLNWANDPSNHGQKYAVNNAKIAAKFSMIYHGANMFEQEFIGRTIYKIWIENDGEVSIPLVNINIRNLDGFATTGQAGSTTINPWHNSEENYRGEFYHDNIYNLINTMIHEKQHGIDMINHLTDAQSTEPWRHFEIEATADDHWSFNYTTKAFKKASENIQNSYLESQKEWLKDNMVDKKANVDKLKTYNSNVDWFNKKFNKNREHLTNEKILKEVGN